MASSESTPSKIIIQFQIGFSSLCPLKTSLFFTCTVCFLHPLSVCMDVPVTVAVCAAQPPIVWLHLLASLCTTQYPMVLAIVSAASGDFHFAHWFYCEGYWAGIALLPPPLICFLSQSSFSPSFTLHRFGEVNEFGPLLGIHRKRYLGPSILLQAACIRCPEWTGSVPPVNEEETWCLKTKAVAKCAAGSYIAATGKVRSKNMHAVGYHMWLWCPCSACAGCTSVWLLIMTEKMWTGRASKSWNYGWTGSWCSSSFPQWWPATAFCCCYLRSSKLP